MIVKYCDAKLGSCTTRPGCKQVLRWQNIQSTRRYCYLPCLDPESLCFSTMNRPNGQQCWMIDHTSLWWVYTKAVIIMKGNLWNDTILVALIFWGVHARKRRTICNSSCGMVHRAFTQTVNFGIKQLGLDLGLRSSTGVMRRTVYPISVFDLSSPYLTYYLCFYGDDNWTTEMIIQIWRCTVARQTE